MFWTGMLYFNAVFDISIITGFVAKSIIKEI